MATAETVQLGPSHPPKEESLKVFREIEVDLKKTIQHLRHDRNKHEPAYFAAVENLSDHQLTHFSESDLKEVRVGSSAYGLHLFGKVEFPELKGAYFFFRAFVVPGDAETAKLHTIHTEEIEKEDGSKTYRAIFGEGDELEWFDT